MAISETPNPEENVNIDSIQQETTFVARESDYQPQQDNSISNTSDMASSHESSNNSQEINILPPTPIIMPPLPDLPNKENVSESVEDEFGSPRASVISQLKNFFNSSSLNPKIPLITSPTYGAIPSSPPEEQPHVVPDTPQPAGAQTPPEVFNLFVYFCLLGFLIVCVAFYLTTFIIGPKKNEP